MNLHDYKRINSCYSKKLVFNFGAEAGFFSELNNMILAIVYCLENKIQFVLYSKNANFRIHLGWQDYFLPFCDETSVSLNSKINSRVLDQRKTQSFKYKLAILMYKKLFGVTYLTSDVWMQIRDVSLDHQYSFPELGMRGSIREVTEDIILSIFRFNKKTDVKIKRQISGLCLPESFCSAHIRAGDKVNEASTYDVVKYVDKIKQRDQECKNLFVLTDDYRMITNLKERFPEYKTYTLCNESEKGYIHSDFMKSNPESKENALIKLLASIQVIRRSNLFVGTYSSNPGMFLGMCMDPEKISCIDFDSWRIW